jgi:hypothetical protein
MNTKMKAVLAGGILVLVSGTAAAGSSVHFGISLGAPVVYAAPVYAPPPPPVAYYPAPVYYTAPAYYAPRPYYRPGVVIRYNDWGHRHYHRHR